MSHVDHTANELKLHPTFKSLRVDPRTATQYLWAGYEIKAGKTQNFKQSQLDCQRQAVYLALSLLLYELTKLIVDKSARHLTTMKALEFFKFDARKTRFCDYLGQKPDQLALE
eukprot:3604567-Pleurochrysis_carterae.AAC.1